jgi:hypothetical protein
MKNLLLIISCGLLSCTACKKTGTVATGLNTDYFVFGDAYGMCRGNCVHLFKYEDDKLFADSMDRLQNPLVFGSSPLNSEHAAKAKHLLNIFPPALKKDSSLTVGCPDCHDQGTYYIAYRSGGSIHQIRIDTDTAQQPEEIRDFVRELRTVLDTLK